MFYPCVRALVVFSLPGIFLAQLQAQVGDKKAEAIRQDHAMIQGKWKVTRLIDDGKESHDHDLHKIFVINGNDGSWSLVADGKPIAKGPSNIDPTAKPKTIDFHIIEANGKRVDFQGIYELGAIKRKICFASRDKGRPKTFEAPKGTGRILVEFEKVD
ncbi:MAG: TIGR03067 domain-containing protein [Gemmataceae bacterium]